MSGALTTGETLTGGTSGATGTVESISTAGYGNNNWRNTELNPPVVTVLVGIQFTEGQQILIASVSWYDRL